MKILLFGEYSNVHATLAKGLRKLGHEVVVASDGDGWKNYERDIDLSREEGRTGGIKLLLKVYRNLLKFRGFDIVQIINPIFLDLKVERIVPIYNYLRRHNKKVVLGAFGMDYYWVDTCVYDKPLRYSDYNIGNKEWASSEAKKYKEEWLNTSKSEFNKYIAETCDGIVACLYEYWVCYRLHFPNKTKYIALPVCMPKVGKNVTKNDRVKVFIGINKKRNEYKGTDIMLEAAKKLQQKYSKKMELVVAESVPFDEYSKMMEGSDMILDQLYSYTPAMNSLLAMSKGIINVGGGEPEHYELLGEKELMPIINVEPNEESVYNQLEKVIFDPQKIMFLKEQSVEYVRKHHDYINVAKQYVEFYLSI